MTVAKITTPGLTAMAVSVALLWGCLIGEQLLVRRAVREQTQALRELNVLRQRQRAVPASVPIPQPPRAQRAAEG